jgi:hypothetical protein
LATDRILYFRGRGFVNRPFATLGEVMKKLFPFILLVAACGKNTPPPQYGTPDECVQLYDHILDLATAENMPSNMPADQLAQARKMIEGELQQSGAAMHFFMYCTSGMTKKQLNCALQAPTLSAINGCRLIK